MIRIFHGFLHQLVEKPEPGEIFITLDVVERCGPRTWIVYRNSTKPGGPADATSLGLFWDKTLARIFGETMKNINEEVLNLEKDGIE